ncbi:MAG TPA: type I glyceraldehyde-3-phosphate dehydrogenase [Streptosporangiaceae bacterium]|nr:type I glyceraldehyde-3-phosphate dehydrogenase [Streptosporangiaceae bacterium]
MVVARGARIEAAGGALDRADLQVVSVNDITDARTLAHLLEFDSTFGRLGRTAGHTADSMIIDGTPVPVLSERDPASVDWGKYAVDIVIESTGKFRTREGAAAHLKAGARKVQISAPGNGADLTVVMGVNEGAYDPELHDVISNASCTTNCVAPMVKVLNDRFGIERGFMTTVHAYTGDQMLLDGPHKDLRRARSAAASIVPATTGAARATGEVIPAVAGRLDGVAVRVPVEDGSLTDLAVVLRREATVEEVNDAFAAAASGSLAGVLRYSTDPIVSRDIIGDPASCVFDSALTQASGTLVKVFGWYDNEWGYTSRLADLAALVGQSLQTMQAGRRDPPRTRRNRSPYRSIAAPSAVLTTIVPDTTAKFHWQYQRAR